MMTIRYQIAVRKNGGRALLKSEVLSSTTMDFADHRPVMKFFVAGCGDDYAAHLDIIGVSGTIEQITNEAAIRAAYDGLKSLALESGLLV